MDLKKLYRKIEFHCGPASGSVKLLLQRLMAKPQGFKITEEQAKLQTDTQFALELEIAEVRDGKLILNHNIQ